MDSKDTKELEHFCSRVDCVENSRHAPMPASELSNGEIINALYILIKNKLAEQKKLGKLSKKFIKDIKGFDEKRTTV